MSARRRRTGDSTERFERIPEAMLLEWQRSISSRVKPANLITIKVACSCLLSFLFFTSSLMASEFTKVPVIGELFPTTSSRWSSSVSLSENGRHVVVRHLNFGVPSTANSFYWNRDDAHVLFPSKGIFSDGETSGWIHFGYVAPHQTIGGLFFDGPRGNSPISRLFLATASPAQVASGNQEIYEFSGFGGDDNRPTGIVGLADNAAWVTTDSAPGHPIEFSLVDLTTMSQETLLERLDRAGFDNPGDLSVRSTINGSNANVLILNVHNNVLETRSIFSWSDTALNLLPYPHSILEEDENFDEDWTVVEASSVSSDASIIGGFVNHEGDGLSRGAPFLWILQDEDDYQVRKLECPVGPFAEDECVLLGIHGELVLGAAKTQSTPVGEREQGKEFQALAWFPNSTEPTPVASLLRTAGLDDEIDGWQFNTVEAVSSDGSTMVGFGLAPNGAGSMWLASVPPTFSFETVALADCHTDGDLDALDLTCVDTLESRNAVLHVLGTLPGDIDGDGQVAFEDFLVVAANFGETTGSYALGDIDISGEVDFADFLLLSGNFGSTPQRATPVPEPSARDLCLVMSIGVLLLLRSQSTPNF